MRGENPRKGRAAGGVMGLVAAFAAATILAVGTQGAYAFNPQPEPPAIFYFGPFEIERDGIVTVHVVHPPDPIRPRGQPAFDSSVPVQISFFGPAGEVILEQRKELRQGAIASVDLSGAEIIAILGGATDTRLRVEVRNLQDRSSGRNNGLVVPQIRIIDGTGVSQYVDPVVKLGFNPQPEPPAR